MQEKTILAPEIIEITNFDFYAKKLCPVCETWHKDKTKKCMFCYKHKFNTKNTLVISFKPLLINDNTNKNFSISYFSVLANKFKNIFFNSETINFYVKFTNKKNKEKESQYFDIFLENIYSVLNLKKIKISIFKKKYKNAFELFSEKRKRPCGRRILMPLFDCVFKRRKIINLSIKNFF